MSAHSNPRQSRPLLDRDEISLLYQLNISHIRHFSSFSSHLEVAVAIERELCLSAIFCCAIPFMMLGDKDGEDSRNSLANF